MNVSRSALLPFSAAQMYTIVADIKAYPAFLNWCEAVELISESDGIIIAKMKIAYSKLNINLTTKNHNTPYESISLTLVDGPFSQLAGEWQFKALSDRASKVSIEMNFSFDRSVVSSIVTKVFEKIINTQLDAFQKRAQQLYGVV